ncbi:MAG: rRNA maturation RNase YbeY [Planctomycetota bacterium]|nr:rRNA maturation RNase YbeY [Planctomycetota bacterium]
MSPEAPSEIEVEIEDLQQMVDLDHDQLIGLVQFVLNDQNHRGRVGLCFVGDEEISHLHQKFMDDSSVTDVITFPLEERRSGQLDGEIVISTETAIRQAPEHHLGPLEETHLYVIHGLLHLLGHDDQQPAQAEQMARLQGDLLKRWNQVNRGLHD